MLFNRSKSGGALQVVLKYTAEVVIIFLGITISFLFEQWREGKRQEKGLIELTESLLSDVEALKTKLKYDLTGSEAWIDQLDSLRQQRTSNKISEQQLIWFSKMITGEYFFLFDPYSPTYSSAASSSLFSQLPDTLRNKLYDSYQVQLPLFQLLYNQQQDNITNFRDNIMVPSNTYLYQQEASAIRPDWQVLTQEIERPAYGNFINQVIITERQVYRMNEKSFKTLSDLADSLRAYLIKLKSS